MKKLLGIMAVVALMAVPALAAAPVNPWQGAQTDVPINVTVQQMVELMTDVTPVLLTIGNAGGNGGSANAVSRNVTHLSNCPVQISVGLVGDIPMNTQFHIIINPTGTPIPAWSTLSLATVSKVISWRREAGGYSGATEVPATNVTGVTPGTPGSTPAFTGVASGSMVNVPVQYFAQAPNIMPQDVGAQTTFTVIWTIAPTA